MLDRARARKYLEGSFHGAQEFIDLSMDEIELHSKKNRDYAFGGDPLGNFTRRSTILALYPNLNLQDEATVALVDMMKQLDAALWLKSSKHEAGVEGVVDRLRDIGVYAKIAIILEQRSKTIEQKKAAKRPKRIKTPVKTEGNGIIMSEVDDDAEEEETMGDGGEK